MGRGEGTFNPEALRTARIANGLSMRALGACVGVSAQQIYAYEHGRCPEPARLKDLAQALRLPPSELMHDSLLPTLATMRRQAGYTSEQFANELGIARATYHRLEQDGIIPRAWDSIEGRAAAILGVSRQALNRAVHPRALPPVRAHYVNRYAAEFADEACVRDRAIKISRGDPRLRKLATALGHPQDQVRAVLLAELYQLRHTARLIDQARAGAAWAESDPNDVLVLDGDVQRFEDDLERLRARLPDNLRSGLRLLGHGQWQLLGRAHRAHPTPLIVPEQSQGLEGLHDRNFIKATDHAAPPGHVAIRVTEEGTRHAEVHQHRYRQLYPDVRIDAVSGRLAAGESWRNVMRLRGTNESIDVGLTEDGNVILRRRTQSPMRPQLMMFTQSQWAAVVEEAQQGRLTFGRDPRSRAAREFKVWEEELDTTKPSFWLTTIFPKPR